MSVTDKEFRDILRAWHNNNGIRGFIDYFFWPHQRSAFYQTKEEMMIAYLDCEGDDDNWSVDYYVNEWWRIWKTRDLSLVFFRSDGSFLDWLISLTVGEEE